MFFLPHGELCGSTAPYLIWLHSSLGRCQYNLTTPKLLRKICQHWSLFKNLTRVRIFEPNHNILAFSRFGALSQLVRLSVFPLASKTNVSCLSRVLATLCWKWTPSPTMSLKRHHWYCSIYLPQSLIASVLWKIHSQGFLWSRAALYLFASLPDLSKVYSCLGQFGAYYSYHSIRQVHSSCVFFPASLDIKSAK